jgi:hypothetical protein
MNERADIRIKRVCAPPYPGNGARVSVDRLWPRGSRTQAPALRRRDKEAAASPPGRAESVTTVGRAGDFGFLGTVREPVACIGFDVPALRAAWVKRLGGTPARRTGDFHDKAMAIEDLPARLAFLNRGQRWVVRRLQALLPRVGDAQLQAGLGAMLAAHEANIARVAVALDG